MLLTDDQVNVRLESSLNLVNRFNRLTKNSNPMNLFIPSQQINQHDEFARGVVVADELSESELDDILPDNAQKIKLGLVRSKALDVLHDSLHQLHVRLPEIDRVKDFSAIASDMNKIITADDNKKSVAQNIIVYKPILNELSRYETLVVNE